jgi:hypothetical protein
MAHRRRTREQWRQLVEGWPESGLTQAQYCEHHNISVASLYRWRNVDWRFTSADARIKLKRLYPSIAD